MIQSGIIYIFLLPFILILGVAINIKFYSIIKSLVKTKYRLVKMEQAGSTWWIIQRKHWLLGWILISDPLFKRKFENEKEAINNYTYFIVCKKKPTRTVIRTD
jgi:hypothetical protein